MTDILTKLDAHQADPAELEDVLLMYFGRARQTERNAIIYGDENSAGLELRYSTSSLPTALIPNPSFQEKDFENLKRIIAEQLLSPGIRRIARAILFTRMPCEGWYRFRDEFQLLPVPADAPRPPYVIGDHPLLLEVSFYSSPNPSVNALRRSKREREIELLCALLIFPNIKGLSMQTRSHWVYGPNQEPSTFRSMYLQAGYTWPGASFEVAAFTDTSAMAPLREMESKAYYGQLGVSIDQTLAIPTTFTASLERAHSLPPSEYEQLIRAIYWYQQSYLHWATSRSLAFIALVSAVETLKGGQGNQQGFVDFVEALAPGIPVDERKRFYRLRSAISHGGKLLHADEVSWGVGSRQSNQDNDMRLLSGIVRVMLLNWLHGHYRPQEPTDMPTT